MRLSIFLFFITIYSIQANNNPEIKFKTNEIEFVNKLQKTWNSSDISIIVKKNEINSVKKNSLIITVKTNFDIDDEKFFELVRTSSSLLFENIQNTASFKAASIDYINTISNNKRSKNIFVIIDKVPVIKGCYKNDDNEKLKKCFNKQLINHIKTHFKPFKFSNIGLEKKKHRVITHFSINEKGKTTNILVDTKNSIVKNDIEELIKNLKVINPGFNNGEAVEVKYTIPISFTIN